MPPTVLIVEDNADNRDIYRTILEFHAFTVLEAEDGADGIAIAQAERPDLILMDISIPIIDGLDATRRLKQDPATAAIPIVALTAHAQREDEMRAMEAGCDSYLAKPVEPHRVVAEVRRLLVTLGEVSSAG
jgi:CheY-like chemotaxis protein